jgi:hypothetical protein
VKSARRPVRLAAAAGLILVAASAAVVGGRSYTGREQPAEPEVLERIARKNEAAALNAAVRMDERSEAVTEAKEARQETAPATQAQR